MMAVLPQKLSVIQASAIAGQVGKNTVALSYGIPNSIDGSGKANAILRALVRFSYLDSLSNRCLQASFTQAENASLFFLALWLICSNKSSSKRICFVVLFERSNGFFSFFSCIGSYRYDRLALKGSYQYKDKYHIKQYPAVLPALTGYLTKTLKSLRKNNVMANNYDNSRARPEQIEAATSLFIFTYAETSNYPLISNYVRIIATSSRAALSALKSNPKRKGNRFTFVSRVIFGGAL